MAKLFYMAKYSLCSIAIITRISTRESTVIFMKTRTFDLKFVYFAGFRVEPLVHVPSDTSKSIEEHTLRPIRSSSP